MQEFLRPTFYFDYEHPAVRDFAEQASKGAKTPEQTAIQLFYAARDQIRYNPYTLSLKPEAMKASYVLGTGQSYCIPKAVLLGAAARYKGIPSKLTLCDVRNHIASQKLLDFLKTDYFAMHGFIEFYLNGNWIKATPAFNLDLCRKMKVPPLDFNGKDDSVFQQHTEDGKSYMEYMKFHGSFEDVPFDLIIKTLRETYPHLIQDQILMSGSSLEDDLKK